MDKECYDSFTEDDRISKEDVSILSAYHAYITSFDNEPTLSEFKTYYNELVQHGLTKPLSSEIKSLPKRNISNYTGNETITSEDVTILDSYQSFLVGNKNKKAKNISEFKSYHDAFMVFKNKKTRLESEIVKLPTFKDNAIKKKKIEARKRRIENLLECGTLEYENIERRGFLYNNREYIGASYGNGNCGKGNKQTFLPISTNQIKKAIEYRENDFLVYNAELGNYEFKYNKSVSLLDYPLIFKKGSGVKAYQIGLSFRKPIYVPRGSEIHFHCVKTTQMQKRKTEEPFFSIDEDTEIQKTGVVAFSENFNSETSDFRQKDWKGNLCGPIHWWFPLDKTRSIGESNTKFKQDTIIYNMFSDLIYGGCALSDKSAFEIRLLAFTITPPKSETIRRRPRPKQDVNTTPRTDFLTSKVEPEIHTEIINTTNRKKGVDIQFQNDISLINSESDVCDNKNLDKSDRDKAKHGVNISFRNKGSLLTHIKIVDDILREKQKELYVEFESQLKTPTPTHTSAEYLQPYDSIKQTPSPTHTNPEYRQPNQIPTTPSPTHTNPEYLKQNQIPTTPSPTHTNPEYRQPNQIPPTPTPTHTNAEYKQPKDKK
jgi:hypothetical protein